MRKADVLFRSLKTDVVFGVPGDDVVLQDALQKSGKRFIVARDERMAGFMADAYAQLKGFGVCLTSLGAGSVNVALAVANSYLSRSPVLYLTGQVSAGKRPHQCISHSLFGPMTEFRTTVSVEDDMKSLMRRVMNEVERGPVNLSLPEDVLEMENGNYEWGEPSRPATEFESLIEGDNAVGLVGAKGDVDTARRLEKAGVPVYETFSAKGYTKGGLVASRYVANDLKSADPLILIGYDEAEGLGWFPRAEVAGPHTKFRCRGKTVETTKRPDHPAIGYIDALRSELAKDDIVTVDVGLHKQLMGLYYPAYEPKTVLFSNGLSSMGYALPAAIGAKIAKPDKRVVAVCGDGGFLMSASELALGCPITVVIFNDGAYGMIERNQRRYGMKPFGVKLRNPDFQTLAKSFGYPAYRAGSPTAFGNALWACEEKGGVIEIPIDYEGLLD